MITLRSFLVTLFLTAVTAGAVDDPSNHYPFAAGTIQKLDIDAKSLTFLTTNGPQTMTVSDRTYMFRGKDKLTFDKLKVGDPIKINYSTNATGQAVIRRLKVNLPPLPEEHRAP